MYHFGSNHPTQFVCRDKPLGRGKIFHDRDIFINHLKKIHPGTPVAKYLTRNHFDVQSTFEDECNFCTCYPFRDWEDRIDHLANHFKANAKANSDESQFNGRNEPVERQNDGLESTVGVKSLLSPGLGSPRSGDLTPERSKEERQTMVVKFRRQPSYTAPRKDNNEKNWEIGQSRHDEPRPYLRSETPDSFPQISDPSRAAIATTDQLPAGDRRLRENKLNAKNPLNDERKKISLRTPSEQCRSKDSFVRERPEAGVRTGQLKSLREKLLDARVSKDDYNFFIPIDAIERLICEEAIRDELSSIPEIDSKCMESVFCIRNDYQKIFGILTIIKKCHLITTFLQEEIKDIELPIRLQHVSLDDTHLTTP
jgi:hypothetical protein